MESKKFTQFGTFTVILLALFLIFSVIMALTIGLSDSSFMLTFGILSLILLICLFFFYKIVIEIDSANISFKMGIGIIGKSYKIAEIESCKSVNNSFIYGWGIHKIPTGWLYNTSGFKSIELTFKNTGKVVRIGTNKSDEIVEIISTFLKTNQNTEEEYSSSGNSNFKLKNSYYAVAVILAIVVLFNLYEYQPVKIDFQKNHFEISGIYGSAINYSDIAAIDTISQMPGIEMKTNGFAVGRVYKGSFKLKNIGSASLFINLNTSPFVQLLLKNSHVIYFNLKDRQSTIDTFEKIRMKTKLNSTE